MFEISVTCGFLINNWEQQLERVITRKSDWTYDKILGSDRSAKRPDFEVFFNIRQFETLLVITRCRIGFLHYFASHAAQDFCPFIKQSYESINAFFLHKKSVIVVIN